MKLYFFKKRFYSKACSAVYTETHLYIIYVYKTKMVYKMQFYSKMNLFHNLTWPDFLIYFCLIITDYINQPVFVFSFANCYRAGVMSLKVFLSITWNLSPEEAWDVNIQMLTICKLLPGCKLATLAMCQSVNKYYSDSYFFISLRYLE